MSRRPSIAGFNLSQLTALFGTRDTSLIVSLIERYEEDAFDNKTLARAKPLFTALIMGDLIANPPAIEDEALQEIMLYLAEYGQDLHYSESLFWEAFLGDVDQRRAKYENGPQDLLGYLLRGRPLVGHSTDPNNWNYYAYFTNVEATRLFDFIRSQQHLRQEYDFEAADNWMKEVEQAGEDVWFYVS